MFWLLLERPHTSDSQRCPWQAVKEHRKYQTPPPLQKEAVRTSHHPPACHRTLSLPVPDCSSSEKSHRLAGKGQCQPQPHHPPTCLGSSASCTIV